MNNNKIIDYYLLQKYVDQIEGGKNQSVFRCLQILIGVFEYIIHM